MIALNAIVYRFIDSEADLDSAIKSLLPLAQVPTVAYPELVRSGQIAAIVGLLSHENADIALDIIELIHELTDEDVGNEGDEEDEEDEGGDNEAALNTLIDSLVSLSGLKFLQGVADKENQLENSILELLVDNIRRFNEAEEADRQGIYNILGLCTTILVKSRLTAETIFQESLRISSVQDPSLLNCSS